jgi:hypothetical protein
MSFIAAVLILNLDAADAFIAFSNLLNKPCQMAFFRVDHGLVSMLCVLPSQSLCLFRGKGAFALREGGAL